jgi:hypothetical protein
MKKIFALAAAFALVLSCAFGQIKTSSVPALRSDHAPGLGLDEFEKAFFEIKPLLVGETNLNILSIEIRNSNFMTIRSGRVFALLRAGSARFYSLEKNNGKWIEPHKTLVT